MWEGLATFYQYLKFFRFRSPVNVFDGYIGGRSHEVTWLLEAIKFIDFTKENFIKESFLIMYYTKGGINKKELDGMPFDEYEIWLKEAIIVQENLTEKEKK